MIRGVYTCNVCREVVSVICAHCLRRELDRVARERDEAQQLARRCWDGWMQMTYQHPEVAEFADYYPWLREGKRADFVWVEKAKEQGAGNGTEAAAEEDLLSACRALLDDIDDEGDVLQFHHSLIDRIRRAVERTEKGDS